MHSRIILYRWRQLKDLVILFKCDCIQDLFELTYGHHNNMLRTFVVYPK